MVEKNKRIIDEDLNTSKEGTVRRNRDSENLTEERIKSEKIRYKNADELYE